MKRDIYLVVRHKREWEEQQQLPGAADSAPSPFRGWYTRGYLPHCDKPGLLQMITYRLHDAMPASRRREWEALFKIQDERTRRTRLEAYLDAGHGECHLRDPRVAALVESGFLHFDGQRYRLLAWVVMPNHVHVLYETWQVPLPKLVDSWKGFTSRKANNLLGRAGTFWQADFWDTYLRDEQHFQKAVHYIESNPVKAALVGQPEEWPFSSANPKWLWSDEGRHGRYRGAHLVHARWQQSAATTTLGARLSTAASSGMEGGNKVL